MWDLDRRAEDLLSAAGGDAPVVRYNIACVLSQGSRYGTPEQREGRGARAVELLSALVATDLYKGGTNALHVVADTDLIPLRARADYKEFLAALRLKFPPPSETAPRPGEVTAMPDPTLTALPETGTASPDTRVPPSDDSPTAAPPPFGFELLGEIGCGGMGVVYRARDRALDREVAVKILRDKYAPDSGTAARFVEEARITGQLQHPGIPAVYQVGTLAGGRPFLAMKLIKGDTLSEMLADGTRFDPLAVFEAVAQAVGYAHAHAVIHRDLKPGNVMVGAFGEVQVMDWGLAKVLGGPAAAGTAADPEATAGTEIRTARGADTPFTRDGSVLGTPAYMPPEQAGGEVEKIDRRSDVFGLGAILCALLTGRPPFGGATAESVRLNAVRGNTADAFARLDASGTDPDVVALCKRCLSFDPAARPATADEVARAVADLRRAADDRARQAERDKLAAEVREGEQRWRRRTAQRSAGAVAAVLLLGIAGTTVGLIRADDARRDAEAAERATEGKRVEAEGARVAAETATAAEAAQRRVADGQARLARHAEAETLADFRAATDDAVEHLIGAQPAIGPAERTYLENTLRRWAAFAARRGDDEAALATRGEGLRRVAYLRQKLGERAAAAAGYRDALAVWRTVADRFPDNPRHRPEAALCHGCLGLLLAEANERDPAREQYRIAIRLHGELAARFPDEVAHRDELANTRNNLGLLCRDLGEREAGAREYEAALVLLGALAAEWPDRPRYRSETARTRNNYGAMLIEWGKWDAAAAQFDAALPVQRRLADESPDRQAYQSELARTYGNRATLLMKRGRPADAVAEFDAALDVQQPLADMYPAVPRYQLDLARFHLNLGILHGDAGDVAAARASGRKALAVQERLAARHPTVAQYRIELAANYLNTGVTCADDGHPADAVPWYDKAVATLAPLLAKEPRLVNARLVLRNAHWSRAEARHRLGRFPEAVADWDRAIELTPPAERPQYQLERLKSLARTAPASAAAAAEDLIRGHRWTADSLCEFAGVFAAAAAGPELAAAAHAERAMDLLSRAVKGGFGDRGRVERDDFAALRDRPDYRKLAASLPHLAPPPRPAKEK